MVKIGPVGADIGSNFVVDRTRRGVQIFSTYLFRLDRNHPRSVHASPAACKRRAFPRLRRKANPRGVHASMPPPQSCKKKRNAPRPAAGWGTVPGKGVARKSYHWTATEHQRFKEGLERFGASSCSGGVGQRGAREKVSVGLGPGVAEQISRHVGTRSVSQVSLLPFTLPLFPAFSLPPSLPSLIPCQIFFPSSSRPSFAPATPPRSSMATPFARRRGTHMRSRTPWRLVSNSVMPRQSYLSVENTGRKASQSPTNLGRGPGALTRTEAFPARRAARRRRELVESRHKASGRHPTRARRVVNGRQCAKLSTSRGMTRGWSVNKTSQQNSKHLTRTR